jgi:hypothetical protein
VTTQGGLGRPVFVRGRDHRNKLVTRKPTQLPAERLKSKLANWRLPIPAENPMSNDELPIELSLTEEQQELIHRVTSRSIRASRGSSGSRR